MTTTRTDNFKLDKVRTTSRKLRLLSAAQRTEALLCFAQLLSENCEFIIEANQQDCQREKNKLSPALYSRLQIDHSKIESLVKGIQSLAKQTDPVNLSISKTLLDDNLILEKITVPIGVIAVIFESRPDVLPQLASLAIRSGNCLVLKGGSEAIETNNALASLMSQIPHLPSDWFLLSHDRSIVDTLLTEEKNIDLIIPRGSKQLVKSITEKSLIPVLGHADGICHMYFDGTSPTKNAIDLILDAKMQYPSACNSLETIIVHKNIAKEFLNTFIPLSKTLSLELHTDERGRTFCNGTEILDLPSSGWSTEYSYNALSIKIVDSLEEAILHINTYGSGHTDGIISNNQSHIEQFIAEVDSASTMVNCSTRFADGFRYGLGAEVGISTGKIHARGPVGIEGLMTYRWVLKGQGHSVSDYVGDGAKEFLHTKI